MKPKLVVFDMAGTTVLDEGGVVNRCLLEALCAAGVSVSAEQVNTVMGLPKPRAIQELLVCGSPSRVAEIHADFVGKMLHHYQHHPSVQEIEATSLVFVRLRQAGIKVALDTGFSREIADAIIERLGWRLLLNGSIASDEVPRGRPFPDMIVALMQHCRISDPQTVAKVGDTPSDLQEGTAAGCGWVIGVTEGSHSRAELATEPHTHLVSTVADLLPLWGI